MIMSDLIFKAVCSILLALNFLCFLWLAIAVTKLEHFKHHLPSTYRAGRLVSIVIALSSVLFGSVVWAADFQQKASDSFKVGLVVIIAAFTLLGAFLLWHRRELFPQTNAKQQS